MKHPRAVRLPLLVLAGWMSGAGVLGQDAPADDPGYRAHEWGTFTSMVDADGAVLEGLHREEEALPEFVHDLMSIEAAGDAGVKFPASRVTQKMETPVIYFHTDRARRVSVHVAFEQGLMTQFHPLPALVFPPLDLLRAHLLRAPLDLTTVARSGLVWDVDLLPPDAPQPAEVAPAAADEPWGLARQVRAAWVRTRPAPGAAVEAERYLFYRGLGRWQPALTLQARDDGVTLENGMEGAVPFLAVLELDERGGRFALGGALAAGAAREVALAEAPFAADRSRLAHELGAAVQQALEASGLHADEARAMVATWSRSWFQRDGARVIYLLPRAEVDRVLPLQLWPPPRELVRTLVGRLEFVTPRAQAAVEAALQRSDEPVLARLDRLLEPHLRNVLARATDGRVRELARRRLAALGR
ncbi:MAG: hypothetical protein AB7O97_23095 [Planctomycetota bacterium]